MGNRRSYQLYRLIVIQHMVWPSQTPQVMGVLPDDLINQRISIAQIVLIHA